LGLLVGGVSCIVAGVACADLVKNSTQLMKYLCCRENKNSLVQMKKLWVLLQELLMEQEVWELLLVNLL
jgi:hypothetical protein